MLNQGVYCLPTWKSQGKLTHSEKSWKAQEK